MPNKSPYTTQDWIDRAEFIWKGRYDYSLVEYTKANEKITIICQSHGPFELKASQHIRWSPKPKCCPECEKEEKDKEIKKDTIYKGREVDYHREYNRSYRKRPKVQQKRAERKRLKKASRKAPEGNRSFGEQLVYDALKTLGFSGESIIEQARFEDCRHINPLPFDFYLPEHNCLIEYQGELHFRPSRYHGGQEKFEARQRNDATKKEWAEENGYLLLRIPYTVNRLDLIVKGLIERLGL